MAIPDKAPETPSRMRKPVARGLENDSHALEDTENKSLLANKRKASEEEQQANVTKRTTATRGAQLTQPPSQRISSLTNPRIRSAKDVGGASYSATSQLPPPPPTTSSSRCSKLDVSVSQRLEDMEKITKELQEKLKDSTSAQSAASALQLQLLESKCSDLESIKQQLESKIAIKEKDLKESSEQIESLQQKLKIAHKDSEVALNRIKSSLDADLESVQRERDRLKHELCCCQSSLDVAQGELLSLKASLSKQSSTIIELEAHIAALKAKMYVVEEEKCQKVMLLEQSQAAMTTLNRQLEELKDKLHVGEAARRKLHNDLQELKGNIRVFCRVRPMLPGEASQELSVRVPNTDPGTTMTAMTTGEPEEICVEQSIESVTGNPATKQHTFTFDKVFHANASQQLVFDEIAQLVQSALDGFRVCIFAYGQTGSGKTYTMEGSPEQLGVIPRAVNQIFEHAERLKGDRGWSFSFKVSFLEIYNETIRDLLSEREHKDTTNTVNNHDIKHISGNKTLVTDLTTVNVTSIEAVLQLLRMAGKSRAVAETLCNDRSSRSHSVFSMHINGTNSATNESIEGLLNLIDLAGSERLSSSGSTGDRLKETQSINKSLSALGDVIAAIAAKEPHIPFRNSKLTFLLQHSLGGNCKTLMFVNVSPTMSSVNETLCSLRFATKVNSCHIGTARRNINNKQ